MPSDASSHSVPSIPTAYHNRLLSAEFADFMSSVPDFWVFRRFEYLNLFNILCLQKKLVDLERRVREEIANEWLKPNGHEIEDLIPELRTTLKEYSRPDISTRSSCETSNLISDDALIAQARLKDFETPQPRVLEAIIESRGKGKTKNELGLESEVKAPDHFALAATEKGWIHRYVDRHNCLRKIFITVRSTDERLTAMQR